MNLKCGFNVIKLAILFWPETNQINVNSRGYKRVSGRLWSGCREHAMRTKDTPCPQLRCHPRLRSAYTRSVPATAPQITGSCSIFNTTNHTKEEHSRYQLQLKYETIRRPPQSFVRQVGTHGPRSQGLVVGYRNSLSTCVDGTHQL